MSPHTTSDDLSPEELRVVQAFVRVVLREARHEGVAALQTRHLPQHRAEFTTDDLIAVGCMFGMLHTATRATRDADASAQSTTATPTEALQQFAARTRQLAFDLAREHGAEWEAMLSNVDAAHPLPQVKP